MKLLQDKYSMNDTVHLTAVPGISVAKGGERELASAEVQESDTVRYVGPFDLRGGQAVFRFDGGHIYIPFAQTYQPRFFYYHVKDHLGNVRVTKIGAGEGGSVLQRMNYYPFGEISEQTDYTSNAMPWKFGGKELDQMHGLNMYDFHARPYDARLGQFTMMDPKAEDYYEVSPYIYCHDDPVNRVDPDGKDDYYTENGSFIYSDNKFTDHIIIRAINPLYKLFPTPFVNQYTYTRIEYADISAKAYSNIYTNILHNNGFDVTRLKNNRVSIVALEYNNRGDGPMYRYVGSYNKDGKVDIPWRDAPIASEKTNKGSIEVTATIFPKGDSDREYLSTVSNVISILGVHELTGHGIKGLKGNMHWKILDMQKRHSSWNNTTFKLRSLYEYLVNNNKEYNTK